MDGRVGLTMEGLGLSHVQDTFVGNEQIRGVSRASCVIFSVKSDSTSDRGLSSS